MTVVEIAEKIKMCEIVGICCVILMPILAALSSLMHKRKSLSRFLSFGVGIACLLLAICLFGQIDLYDQKAYAGISEGYAVLVDGKEVELPEATIRELNKAGGFSIHVDEDNKTVQVTTR